MVKSMSSGYHDVVGIYPEKGWNTETLFKCYHGTVTPVKCGIQSCRINRGRLLLSKNLWRVCVCGGEMKPKFLNELTNDNLFLLFDSMHSAMILYKSSIKIDEGIEFKENFLDIQDVNDLEMSKPLRIAHKLSLNVLNPKSTEKTSMKYASAINQHINFIIEY